MALVAIFFLDFSEYRKQGKDREDQHKETLEQLRIMERQAKATSDSVVAAQRQAESALESFRLLQTQWLEERHRELLRALSVLDDIQDQLKYWKDISNNKWGSINEATSILPGDSTIVLIQAARHSSELRNEVRDAFRMIANADQQIAHFYRQPQNYRQQTLMESAHLNLVNVEPKLTHIVGVLGQMEAASSHSG